ncbi:MAG: DUF3488 and transglutaminase-like domain-containing protein, partial [Nocardioidaceae bacterium]|nr:DUF3488 and transglutaminase-like domain-containing protein [Nocardioidaceae bacterium]
MSRHALRPAIAGLLVSAVAAATTLASLTAWHGFSTRPWDHFDRLLVLGLVVVVTGTATRWSPMPRWTTTLIQAAVVTATVSLQLTGSLLPVGTAAADIGSMLDLALDSARTYRAPVGADAAPLWPLVVVIGGSCLFLIDTLACTWRKVPAAGLVLLAIYAVPSGLLAGDPGWLSFIAGSTGFLLLLCLDAREQVHTWGRTIASDTAAGGRGVHTFGTWWSATRIGVASVLVAVLGAALIPVMDVAAFRVGQGPKSGEIRIREPVTDMRRDLSRDADVPLITMRTDDPAPDYLRISTLNRYTGDQWSSGDRSVAREDRADGALPWPAGLSRAVPHRKYDYQISITDRFNATWLPTTFPAAAVNADGDWRFDPSAMDFLAAADDLDTRNLRYNVTSLVPSYGTAGRFFRDARPGAVDAQFTDLPSSMPTIVDELARSVTKPAVNHYQEALLLQRWFRTEGGFRYSLERAPQGTGNQTLAGFLSPQGRVGYCEQYASAMAVMARTLGIPARVSVGFLEPKQTSDGVWQYSSHDLHSWPELYFKGAGWVRFEPTPAGRAPTVPDYSRVQVGSGSSP